VITTREHRATAFVVALLIALTGFVGTASAADNHAGITFGQDCYGWGPTCHTIFSRSYTHNVLAPAASGTAQSALAAAIGICTKVRKAAGGVTCSMIFGTYTGASLAAIAQAAAQNQCAGCTTYLTDAIAIWRTDNGPDCKP
jgi:hypothetical protein